MTAGEVENDLEKVGNGEGEVGNDVEKSGMARGKSATTLGSREWRGRASENDAAEIGNGGAIAVHFNIDIT